MSSMIVSSDFGPLKMKLIRIQEFFRLPIDIIAEKDKFLVSVAGLVALLEQVEDAQQFGVL